MQSAVFCSISIAQVLAGVLCLLLTHLVGCGKARTGNKTGVHYSKPNAKKSSNSTAPNFTGSSSRVPTSTSVPENKISDKPNKSTSNTSTPNQAKLNVAVPPRAKDPKSNIGNEDDEIDDLTDVAPSPCEKRPFNQKKAKGAFWHFFLKRDNDRRRRTKRTRQEQQKNLKAPEEVKTAAEAEDDKITYETTQQEGGTCATAKGNTNMTTNTQAATCSTFKSTPSHALTAQKVE